MAVNTEAYVLSKGYTAKSLTGAGALKGDKGDDGVSVVGMTIDSNNHLVSTLSNGSTLDAGEISIESTEVETLVEEKVQEQIETQLDDTIQEKVDKAVEEALQGDSSSEGVEDEIDSWF